MRKPRIELGKGAHKTPVIPLHHSRFYIEYQLFKYQLKINLKF